MTLDEAREIYEQLEKIFGPPVVPYPSIPQQPLMPGEPWPVQIPWCQPNPWRNPGWPDTTIGDPPPGGIIFCKSGETTPCPTESPSTPS